ncbi:phenoloxidase-activating factor 3-like [Condylostylus longicornis]|uniref:phenoloxidase-activating factor 3-like n=1 Tax=Condylostylus longicornis TaxID=2530218 RepID=UPI00244E073C|nr:phenoloxidase-activating factor 3-like [Condylostylus longicornis]
MCKILIFLTNVLLIFLTNLNDILAATKCRTPSPENENGWCVPTSQCKIINDISGVALNAFPSEYQTFIENSKCADDSEQQFCCTLKHINPEYARKNLLTENVQVKPVIPARIPTIPNVNRADISDVDLHPNLNLLPAECGLMKDEFKVSFGEITGLREFPFMALLQFDVEKPYFGCGGTLINEKYVLTAAHCVRSTLFSVRLGEHDVNTDMDCVKDEEEESGFDCNDPVQDIPIESKTVHSKFDRFKAENDIALLRLTRSADVKRNNVYTICLPTNAELRNTVFNTGQLSGWGTTEKGNVSHVLLKGTLDINTQRPQCEDFYSKTYSIDVNEKLICAAGKNKVDSCKGDSGGPLFQQKQLKIGETKKFLQFGIVAAGPGIECGSVIESGGSIYTNVPRYMKWILDNIKP